MRTGPNNRHIRGISRATIAHVHSRSLLSDKKKEKKVLLCVSSQPAAGVSPIHAEAGRQVPHLGERSDGATGEETF